MCGLWFMLFNVDFVNAIVVTFAGYFNTFDRVEFSFDFVSAAYKFV